MKRNLIALSCGCVMTLTIINQNFDCQCLYFAVICNSRSTSAFGCLFETYLNQIMNVCLYVCITLLIQIQVSDRTHRFFVISLFHMPKNSHTHQATLPNDR